MDIRVFSKTDCGYCHAAKDWLKENDIQFQEINLDNDEERQKFYESCGENVRTVPQIFIDGKRIGGYSELLQIKNDILSQNLFSDEDF